MKEGLREGRPHPKDVRGAQSGGGIGGMGTCEPVTKYVAGSTVEKE